MLLKNLSTGKTKKKTFRSREHQWYVPTNSGGKKKIISVVHKFFQKFEEDLFCDVHMLSPKWDKDSIRKSKQNKTKNLRATIPNENRKKKLPNRIQEHIQIMHYA